MILLGIIVSIIGIIMVGFLLNYEIKNLLQYAISSIPIGKNKKISNETVKIDKNDINKPFCCVDGCKNIYTNHKNTKIWIFVDKMENKHIKNTNYDYEIIEIERYDKSIPLCRDIYKILENYTKYEKKIKRDEWIFIADDENYICEIISLYYKNFKTFSNKNFEFIGSRKKYFRRIFFLCHSEFGNFFYNMKRRMKLVG